MRSLRLAFLGLAVFALAGCGGNPPPLPPAEDTVAREFIDTLRLGQVDAAYLRLDPAVRDANGMRGLEATANLFHGGKTKKIELIGGKVGTDARIGGRTVLALTYQVELTTGWFAGNIGLDERDGLLRIAGARFTRLPASLGEINAFTLHGRQGIHWLFLYLAVALPLFTLAVLVVCLRSRVRYKWLGALGIVIGIVAFQFNWSDGALVVSPVTVQFFSAGANRQGLYGPWMITVAVPLGAILFLALRARLPLRKPPGKRKKG
jgi:hypothetical protein